MMAMLVEMWAQPPIAPTDVERSRNKIRGKPGPGIAPRIEPTWLLGLATVGVGVTPWLPSLAKLYFSR